MFPNPYLAPVHEVPDETPATQDTPNTQESQASTDTEDEAAEPTDSLVLADYRRNLATQPQNEAPPARPATKTITGPLPFALTITKVKRTLENIFILPWNTFLLQSKKNATALALQKLATDHFDTSATETAAMEIDTEPPARRELIEEMVQKAVDKRTAKLNSEVGRLRSQLATTKNSNRGQATGANKTKSSAPSTANRGRSRSQKRAAAKPNATTAASKNKTPRSKNSNKQSPSRSKNSNSNRKQSSRTGTRS